MNGKNTLHVKLLDGGIQLSLGDQIGIYDSEGILRSVLAKIGGPAFPGKVVLNDMRRQHVGN